jgi:type I restriction enzyme S subunit
MGAQTVMGLCRFKPYRAYKDTGVEWLGEIPTHWGIMRLGQVMQSIMDFRGRTPRKVGMDWGGDIPAISAVNVRDGYIDLSRGVNYGSQALHDRWMSQGPTRIGDIVFTTEAPVGNVALLPDEKQYILSQRVVLLRPSREHFGSQYLRYYLSSSAFRQGVESQATGSTAEGIKRRYLMAMQVCLPPIDEQIAMAAVFDRETAKIDALVAKKERLIELLQEKRVALITRAVTKGLAPNVPMKDSGVEWVCEIPAHWEVRRIKFFTTYVTSGSRGWAEYYSDDGAIFLRIGNLTRTGIELDLTEVQRVTPPSGAEGERTRVRANDVLISITAYIGSVAVVDDTLDAYVNQHIALTRPALDRVSPRWIAYCFLSAIGKSQFQQLLYGGTKDGLGLDDVRNLIASLPPVKEQTAIVEFLDKESAKTDSLIAKIGEGIEKLKEYRAALISAAVTGKIDVRTEIPS